MYGYFSIIIMKSRFCQIDPLIPGPIPTRSDTNLVIQSQKVAKNLKFRILDTDLGSTWIVRTKALTAADPYITKTCPCNMQQFLKAIKRIFLYENL